MSEALLYDLFRMTVLVGLTIAGLLIIHLKAKNLSRKISYLRFFVQTVSEFAIFYLISYSHLWLSIVLATLLLATLVSGRFFCGWICPFGFYMDLVSLFRQGIKKRYINLTTQLNIFLHNLRYALVVFFLISPVFVIDFTNPWTLWHVRFLSGPFNPLRILLAPLVPLISPWKTLYESNLNFPYVDQIVHYSSQNLSLITALIFVALTLSGSFIVRRLWCRFCPTGVSAAALNRLRSFHWAPILHLEKDNEKCTKCGICKRVCTVQVTEVYENKGGKIETTMCMLCLRCVEMCPYESCLKVKFSERTLFTSRNWLEHSLDSSTTI